MENKWRAARYGLDGKLIDFGKQKEVPARDLVREYLEFVDDVVDELDSREELEYIHEILETGSGADRQLRVFEETGDLKKVVDYIIEETEAGLGGKRRAGRCKKNRLMTTSVSSNHKEFHKIPFDPGFTPGAHNAVNVCLRVKPDEKVCVITDEATLDITSAIVVELEKMDAPYHAWILEDLAPRPLTDMPREILNDLETSQVSIFAVQAQTKRTALAHSDDRRGQPAQDSPCPHGQHQPANHARRHACGFPARRPAQPEGRRDGAEGVEDPRHDCGWH